MMKFTMGGSSTFAGTAHFVCPFRRLRGDLSHLPPEIIASLCDETPLCKLGTPENVADLVEFLASDKASFITGQIIGVDGGYAI